MAIAAPPSPLLPLARRDGLLSLLVLLCFSSPSYALQSNPLESHSQFCPAPEFANGAASPRVHCSSFMWPADTSSSQTPQSPSASNTSFGSSLGSFSMREVFAGNVSYLRSSHLNSTSSYALSYLTQSYEPGWFSPGEVLDVHVAASQLKDLIKQRTLDGYFPIRISAFAVTSPQVIVYFSILWRQNKKLIEWVMVYEVDGVSMQSFFNTYGAGDLRPLQVESYGAVITRTIMYAAVFVHKSYFSTNDLFSAVFGAPMDESYCCSLTSRFTILQKKGLKLISLSVSEDPATGGLFVADVWDSAYVSLWQAGIKVTSLQLEQQLMQQMDNSNLILIGLKGYQQTKAVISSAGTYIYRESYFAYIAQKRWWGAPKVLLTTHISLSGLQQLLKSNKPPPLLVAGYTIEGAQDPVVAGGGDMYTALWEMESQWMKNFWWYGFITLWTVFLLLLFAVVQFLYVQFEEPIRTLYYRMRTNFTGYHALS
eukprot:TRINITY_DN3188_c0_g1_i2.p1 TRINITY_DN3188_c0_g1~~TRINITY_DN3188_c0_g1_i2.p1  ORF type:complete len:492 (-),score=94.82 TRINITY_DN3188_c0_g1_i2:72-1517(-)